MNRLIHIFSALLLLLLIPYNAMAQPQIICQNDPSANYHVFGSPGSTFTWSANGNGTITGQGNDSISVSWVTTPGDYTLSVFETTVDGCPGPLRTLDIRVVSYSVTRDVSICQGQSFTLPDGSSVSSNGTYPVTITSSTGCDSVVITNLTVTSGFAISVNAQICQGQSFTLPDGSSVSAGGSYPVTLQSSAGCDSVVTTNLTVNPVANITVAAQICQGQTYTLPDGSTVSAGGSFPVTLQSSGGCDSIITTNLTVVTVLTTSVDAQICNGQSYTLPDGSTVSTNGSFPVTLQSSAGCDSIITTNLTVISIPNVSVNAQICQGQSFTLPDGSTVSSGGSFPVTLQSSLGCDSIVTTNLTVNPIFNIAVNAQICQGQSFTLPDGSSVSAGGSYLVTLQSSAGCDSVVTTNLTVNPVANITVAAQICQGQTYTLPDGSTVSANGSYPVTLQSSSGCDSVITTNLNIVTVLTTSVDAQICNGQSYTLPDGSTVSTNGSFPVTLQSSAGCDSVVTTNLTVVTALNTSVNAQICQGQSFTLPDGSSVTTGGNYPVTLQSSAGCDSIVTTNLTIISVSNISVSAQICQGQSFTLPDGSTVSAGGNYPVTLQSSTGCDSVVTTNLTVIAPINTSVNAQICTGQTYTLPDGSTVNTNGVYPVILQSSAGCDSIVSTNLTVVNALNTTVNAQICTGQSYTLPDGSSVSTGGNYPVTLLSSGGCDSVVTTNLTISTVLTSSVNAQICSGQTYTLPDGSSVSADGSYPVTLQSSAGCDSVVTTNLTVIQVSNTTVDAQICQGQTYTLPNDTTVSANGSYPVTLLSSAGCDSVITTNLTVVTVLSSSVDAQICQGQTFTLPDGSTVSANGSYPVTLQSSAGCDSVVTTNLTVIAPINTTVSAQICSGQSYTLPDGSTVTTNGVYPVILQSSSGCDSIITTNLTVVNTLTSTVDAQICTGQSYTLPNGATVTVSGSYPVTLQSSAGCDSVVTTNLDVVNVLTSTVNAQICTGQTYTLPDGSTVSANGSYPVTLQSSAGCDSIVTTNLTISNTLTSTVDAQICEGASYTLPDGSIVSAGGSYPVTLLSSGGCDSIVTTNLTVNPITNSTVDAQICQGQTYTLPNGTSVSANGSYPVTITSSLGCDSVITTNLTVVNTITTSVDAQICQGQSYTLPNGTSVTVSGSYPVTFQSSAGCDSVITTNLTVNPAFSQTITEEICAGESFTLPDGSIVTISGIYPVVFNAANGCDSTIITDLTVNPLPDSVQIGTTTFCQGDSLLVSVQLNSGEVIVWPDGSDGNTYIFTETGTYPVIVSNACGSTTTNVSVVAEDCRTCEVFLPNAFTPNADGVNDRFTPILTCEEVIPYLFRVYNRWGELVFETNVPGVGWDGVYDGKQQPTDAYIYYVSYFNLRQGKELIVKGVVSKLN